MKGAGFSVHGIQSSRDGNQTLQTNGNHAVLTQWWLACRWLILITTYSHREWVWDEWAERGGQWGRGRDGWGKWEGEKRSRNGSSWYKLNQGIGVFPSLYSSPSVLRCVLCIGYWILNKLIIGYDAGQISEISYNKISDFTITHLW